MSHRLLCISARPQGSQRCLKAFVPKLVLAMGVFGRTEGTSYHSNTM